MDMYQKRKERKEKAIENNGDQGENRNQLVYRHICKTTHQPL